MEANENWAVGDRIEYRMSMPYRGEDGEKCHDSYILEARITKIEGNLAYWATEKFLEVHKGNRHVELERLLPRSGGFNTAFKIPYIKRIGEPLAPMPQWLEEFGQKFEVPPEITEMVAEGELDDASWHNDVCPSFTSMPSSRYTLWVDHPVRDEREMEGDRYGVTLNTYHEDSDGEGHVYYSGDDLKAAIKQIRDLEEDTPKTVVADKPIADFSTRLLEATIHFNATEITAVQECLRLYREYREANNYQKVPIGLEGLQF